jgi:CelD/BcsL family acetyltransferase involved in cellulose biosynthesis
MESMLDGYLGVYERLAHRAPAVVVPEIRTEVVQSFNKVVAIEEEYRSLFEACPRATPFSSPDWLMTWWRHLRVGEIRTVTVRRGGRLVALAPLMVDDRAVRFIGTGETDYMDVLAVDDSAAAALWDGIRNTARNLNLSLEELRGDSIALRTMPPDLRASVVDGCVCPVVDLNCSEVPAKLLKNVRAQLRRLSDARFVIATRSTADEFINSFLRLHSARWNAAGQAGVLSAGPVRRFHREAAPRLLRSGLLRMHGLQARGRLCAVLYCLARGATVYYYLGGFDPQLAAHGPGTILLHEAMESARRDGYREFDMLRGTESYKYRWGARNRLSRNIIASPQKIPHSSSAPDV